MTRQRHTISIDLTLAAPFLVQGSDPGRFGLDSVLLRNHEEKLVIPGTLLIGRLLDAWTQLHGLRPNSMPSADLWFGKKSHLDDANPRSGLLIEDDLVLTHVGDLPLDGDSEAAARGMALTVVRITQDKETGAVKAGHLQMIEQADKAGQHLRFTGVWRAYATPDEARTLASGIRAGLAWQTQLGALRNIGFGRVHDVKVSVAASRVDDTPVLFDEHTRVALQIAAPICVGTRSRRGNVFESDDVIPGATLKGALARTLTALHNVATLEQIAKTSALARHFHALRITHAFPAADGATRPMPIPLSLIAGGKNIGDAVLCRHPQLVESTNGKWLAPRFPVDWKKKEFIEAGETSGWGATGRHLRVRTAIDADKRTAAGEALFAYEMCFAQNHTRWLCDIDLSAVEVAAEQAAMRAELAELFAHGLDFIGKTKAHAKVDTIERATCWPDHVAAEDGYWTVQLLTPTQLFTVTELGAAEKDLDALYRAVFAELSGNVLALSHHFASQSLAGGQYLHMRFSAGTSYRPYLLTDAGSVFVFTAADAGKAKALLERWRHGGLPVPACVKAAHGLDWRKNPYLPQNGYGEIAVNPRHGFDRVQPATGGASREQA